MSNNFLGDLFKSHAKVDRISRKLHGAMISKPSERVNGCLYKECLSEGELLKPSPQGTCLELTCKG
eukprot:432673-Amphidinium_carterae.1